MSFAIIAPSSRMTIWRSHRGDAEYAEEEERGVGEGTFGSLAINALSLSIIPNNLSIPLRGLRVLRGELDR
jgi:hypothetical protein